MGPQHLLHRHGRDVPNTRNGAIIACTSGAPTSSSTSDRPPLPLPHRLVRRSAYWIYCAFGVLAVILRRSSSPRPAAPGRRWTRSSPRSDVSPSILARRKTQLTDTTQDTHSRQALAPTSWHDRRTAPTRSRHLPHMTVIDAMGRIGLRLHTLLHPGDLHAGSRLPADRRSARASTRCSPTPEVEHRLPGLDPPRARGRTRRTLRATPATTSGIVGRVPLRLQPARQVRRGRRHILGRRKPGHNEVCRLAPGQQPPAGAAHDLWRGKLCPAGAGHIIAARLGSSPRKPPSSVSWRTRAIEAPREYAADYGKELEAALLPRRALLRPPPALRFYRRVVRDFKSIQTTSAAELRRLPHRHKPRSRNATRPTGPRLVTNEQWKLIAICLTGALHGHDRLRIGRIMDVARELGILDDHDASLLLRPDHGEFTGSHRLNDKGGPMMYDGSYNVPSIALSTASQPRGTSSRMR